MFAAWLDARCSTGSLRRGRSTGYLRRDWILGTLLDDCRLKKEVRVSVGGAARQLQMLRRISPGFFFRRIVAGPSAARCQSTEPNALCF
jgi:hypothetical protein